VLLIKGAWLIRYQVREDLQAARCDELVKQNGYKIFTYHE